MVPENRRVLALMPHPDDAEILCVGTLIRLRELGWEVHIATMTPGDKGSVTLPPDEIAVIRRAEAKRAAEAIGAASYHCLEFADCEIVFDNASRRRVASLLRTVNPSLIFTTPPHDYMLDHEITSHLVRDACFNAPMCNYRTEEATEPSSGIPYLYYTDAIEGHDILGQPSSVTCRVDISAQMEQKIAALACHDSQRSWLQKQHGMDDYIEAMKRWSAVRGEEIGVAYAEAFCQHRGHAYPADDLLASLLNSTSSER
jgi:N-acetylglucosamine malate deacetylase 1